ncbi:MAG: hypothetical protein K5695_00170 [Oscillospiraceae bacterium]|nr:hypothetical protein [Oscillospiraceae bacterium]
MFKKITALLLTAAVCLPLSACHGLPKPISYYQDLDDQEAEELVQENRQTFIDQIADVYGDSAKLSNIECVRVFPDKYDPGYKSYTHMLKGTLTIDGTDYEALYSCYDGQVRDSVHTDAICSELTDALPLDKSKILEIYYPESTGDWDYGKQWKFPSRVTTLDEALTWENRSDATIQIWIYTTEDLRDMTENDFAPIPQMQKVADATSNCQILILSLANKDTFGELREQMLKDHSYIDRALYPTYTDEEAVEILSEHHLTCMLRVGNDFDLSDEKPHRLLFKKATEDGRVLPDETDPRPTETGKE